MSTLKANTIQPVSSGVPLVVDSSLRVNGSTSIVSLLAGSATESPTAPLTIRGGGLDSNTLVLYTRNGVNSYGMRIFEDADSSEWVRFRANSGNSNSADTAGLQKGFWFSPDDDSCALSIWTRTKGGKVGVYAAADDTSARLKVGIGDYLSLTDYCADFTSDGNDGGWGGILFSQNSTNAFKLWTQGTGSGGGAGRLVLGYVNRSTGALTGGGFESEVSSSSGVAWNPVLMEIRHDTGLVRANSLSLQNFDGGNVAVKPARVSSAGVGHVVPLFTWSSTFSSSYETMLQTTPLPQGKWFVHFTSSVDSSLESENPHGVMAHVWDVPASKWLTFATVGNAQANVATSSTGSGVFWKIHDSLGTLRSNSLTLADITIANGWTEFVRATSGGGDAGGNCYSLGNQNSEDSTKYGFVYNNKWVKPLHIAGYAIRIA